MRFCRTPPVSVVPLFPGAARRSALLRANSRLTTPDALIIGSARDQGCAEIVGNDAAWRQSALGISYRHLDTVIASGPEKRRTGLERVLYREKHRTSYQIGSADISIDQYPGIPALVEVEAPDSAAVEAMCASLGLDFSSRGSSFGSIQELYKRYGLQIDRGGLRFTEQQRRSLLTR